MKKLLLILLLSASFALAMEPSHAPIQDGVELSITQPCYNSDKKRYEIEAHGGQTLIGQLTYIASKRTPGKWRLKNISVHRDWRKQDIHLGQLLFKMCIDDIKSKGGTQLVWKALPQDHIIDLDTLILIYKRMVANLGFSQEAFTIGKRKGSGMQEQVRMKLQL